MHHNKTTFKNSILALLTLAISFAVQSAHSAEYAMDIKGKHAFIQFKVSHLGYGYVIGEFPKFTGQFSWDADNPSASSVEVNIDTTSIESQHAKRDVHLRGKDFLNVKKFPTAKFVSTQYQETGRGAGLLTGDLTLRGVTRPVTLEVQRIGEGKDPWGGYRAGFEGTTTFAMADFGIDYNLGPASRNVEIYFAIEGIRK